jgi:hypothetical protein
LPEGLEQHVQLPNVGAAARKFFSLLIPKMEEYRAKEKQGENYV